MSSPALHLLEDKTTRSLQIRRPVEGIEPVPSLMKPHAEFIPATMMAAWHHSEGPAAEERFSVRLWPADRRDFMVDAHWAGTRAGGYPAAMPEAIRTVTDELHRALATGGPVPDGELHLGLRIERKFMVTGESGFSMADGTTLSPSGLAVSVSAGRSESEDCLRIDLHTPRRQRHYVSRDGYRHEDLLSDTPDWIRNVVAQVWADLDALR